MPSPFDDLMADVDAAIIEAFGETEGALLRPRMLSQYSGRAADPARPACTINGVFSAGPGDGPIRGNSNGEFAGTTRLASGAVELWLPPEQVAALPYEVAVGDLIEFTGRAGAPVYAVARIQKTDLGDVNLILVSEDRQE